MPKRKVRVGGYNRRPENVKAHARRGTRVKAYTQKRQTGKTGKRM